jgi:c-di-GMP-binding flagellar brake protein YcgR
MQAITEVEIEKWHDYEVRSRREIVALLRQIAEKNQLVRLLIKGESDVCVTSLLHVDADDDLVVLDRSINREQNERIVAAPKVMCETSLDKIRILFQLNNLGAIEWQGGGALRATVPATLIRLQRREYYRMETPVTNPVRVTIPVEGAAVVFPLADISCGGIAILDNKLQLSTTIGASYPNCRIELPEIGAITATLQVRNSQDLQLLNNKTNRRIGCQFVDISRANLAGVQRYITKLERDRNARLAGMA